MTLATQEICDRTDPGDPQIRMLLFDLERQQN
jgi:hypothetical protein